MQRTLAGLALLVSGVGGSICQSASGTIGVEMSGDAILGRENRMSRNHGMDAIRAIALVAGIGLHSTLSFLPGMRMIGMTVVDYSPSLTLSGLFFFVHMFRMPLFFLIAGYFAHMLVERKGLREFARNRWRRIGVPLFTSWLCCYPVLVMCALWSAAKLGTLLTRPELGTQPTWLRVTLMHLWFLYVLLQFYAVTVIACWAYRQWLGQRSNVKATRSLQSPQLWSLRHWSPQISNLPHIVAECVCSPWAPLVASIVIGSIFLTIPQWFWWFGVPTPDRSLITDRAALLIYGCYYAIGWCIFAQPQVLKLWQREAWRHTLLGLGCYVACMTLVGVTPQVRGAPEEPRVVIYALMYGMGQWCLVVASMSWGLRLFSQPSARLRYLSDASYWMYLAHLPIVILLQVIIMQWPVHWTLKFVFINAVTFGLLWLSYEWFVRQRRVLELASHSGLGHRQ